MLFNLIQSRKAAKKDHIFTIDLDTPLPDIEIYRTANVLVSHHGDKSAGHSASKRWLQWQHNG